MRAIRKVAGDPLGRRRGERVDVGSVAPIIASLGASLAESGLQACVWGHCNGGHDASIDASAVRGRCLDCGGRSVVVRGLGLGVQPGKPSVRWDGHSAAIADPDDQFTNSGPGAHPFGANGPTLQFGIQQQAVTPFGNFRGNDRDGSPPDPYFHPPGNGNN